MDEVILVTGAGGFVARHLTRALAGDGSRKVVALGRTASRAPLPGVENVYADLSDPAQVEALSSRYRFDTIVHLAGKLSKLDNPEVHRDLFSDNAEGTLQVLEMAHKHGSRMIFASTGLIYGNQPAPFREDMAVRPGDFYSFSKHLAEQAIAFFTLRYGLKALVLRPSLLYGPHQEGEMFIPSIMNALLAGRDFPMTAGRQKRDFLYIDDFTAAVKLGLAKGLEGTFNVAAGEPHTLAETAALVGEATGRGECIKLGALEYRPGESWEYALDIGKIRRETGWEPKVGLREGIQRVVAQARGKGISGAD